MRRRCEMWCAWFDANRVVLVDRCEAIDGIQGLRIHVHRRVGKCLGGPWGCAGKWIG
jgi:hypothetical protein